MATDELGLPVEASDPTTDIFSEEWTGEEAIVEAPAEPAAEAAPAADETLAPEAEATGETEETTPDPALDEAKTGDDATPPEEDSKDELPPLIAGRFKTQEDADAYIKETQAAYTRGQQQLAETKRQLAMAQQVADDRAAAQDAKLAALEAEMVQARAFQLAQLDLVDPERAAQIRAQQAAAQQQQRTAMETQRVEAERIERENWAYQQRIDQENQARLNEFYFHAPDARGHEDEIAAVAQTFNDRGEGWGIDLRSPDGLEIAYELAKEPALMQRLINMDLAPDTMRSIEVAREVGDDQQLQVAIRANPAYGATEESLAVARQLLAAPALKKAQEDAAATAKAEAEAARKNADIEPGNAGTPDESAPDDWDVIDEWKKESSGPLNFMAST